MRDSNPASKPATGSNFCNIVHALLGSGIAKTTSLPQLGLCKAGQMVSRPGTWLAKPRRLFRRRSSGDPERFPFNVVSVLFRPTQHVHALMHIRSTTQHIAVIQGEVWTNLKCACILILLRPSYFWLRVVLCSLFGLPTCLGVALSTCFAL